MTKNKIHTSNFSTAGKHPNAVAISRGIPRWYKGKRYLPLAPTWAMVKVKDPTLFTREYESVLKALDPSAVLQDLGPNPILLCWEKAGEFCHRIVVGDWLRAELGVEVSEFEPEQATAQSGK